MPHAVLPIPLKGSIDFHRILRFFVPAHGPLSSISQALAAGGPAERPHIEKVEILMVLW